MTRLTPADLEPVGSGLADTDNELIHKTGKTLAGIALSALNLEEEVLVFARECLTAIIPISSGEGVIPGFTGSLKAIAMHLGFPAFITERTDVSGIAEASARRADILFMADDRCFIALNTRNGYAAENSAATAWAFTAVLSALAGGLAGTTPLIVGCGAVGRHAALEMLRYRAVPVLVDIVPDNAQRLARELENQCGVSLQTAPPCGAVMRDFPFIFSAACHPGVIGEEHITPGTVIAAPGVPLNLTPGAALLCSSRFYHDPLQAGVAVMLLEAFTGSRAPLGVYRAITRTPSTASSQIATLFPEDSAWANALNFFHRERELRR